MMKPTIRSEMLAQRARLSAEIGLSLSLDIQKNVLSLPEFEAASSVALYSAYRNEVFTEALFRCARKAGKVVAYPRIRESVMEFVEVRELDDLQPGAFGILEPTGSARISVHDLDMLAIPGVAFDLEGYRLGYGKGYYDRVLHGIDQEIVFVGLCYDFQLIPNVPAENHDIRMDVVVTESHIHRCRP
jgi:5-formyltetrahydrofolate cyclo-ligase